MTVSAPQLGKTIIGCIWLLSAAWMGGKSTIPWWWTAPTYAQCRDGFVNKFCNLARSAGVLKHATTTPPFMATLTNGAIIEARSWDNPEGMYGPTIRGAVVDEFGRLTDQAYSAISSRRAESVSWGEGFLRFLGNVGDIGGTAESLWQQAEAGEPGFASRRWTWRDRAAAHDCRCGNGEDIPLEIASAYDHTDGCLRGIYCQFVAMEASRMSSPQFRTLYEAEWCDWNALPVYAFDRAVHIDPSVTFDKHLPIDLSCDFNVDPMCWAIGQHRGNEAWTVDEIVIPGGATTEAACQEFLRRVGDKSTDVVVYGDASGKSRSTKSRQSDYAIIQAQLAPHFRNFRIEVPAANPAVQSRVDAFNSRLRSATGEVRYRMHPRCTVGADDLARVSWKPGTRDIDKSNKTRTHWTDADGYRMASLYAVNVASRAVVGLSTHRTGESLLEATF